MYGIHFCLVWYTPNRHFYRLYKLQMRQVTIIDENIAASLKRLTHPQAVVSVCFFYRYHFADSSTELNESFNQPLSHEYSFR